MPGEGAVWPATVTNGSRHVQTRLVEIDDPADFEDDDARSGGRERFEQRAGSGGRERGHFDHAAPFSAGSVVAVTAEGAGRAAARSRAARRSPAVPPLRRAARATLRAAAGIRACCVRASLLRNGRGGAAAQQKGEKKPAGTKTSLRGLMRGREGSITWRRARSDLERWRRARESGPWAPPIRRAAPRRRVPRASRAGARRARGARVRPRARGRAAGVSERARRSPPRGKARRARVRGRRTPPARACRAERARQRRRTVRARPFATLE